MLQLGSFGGTYFRSITSSVTGEQYKAKRVLAEFPKEWFDGLDIKIQVASKTYDKHVNRYRVKCGGSLDMWESSGWISAIDPYGWFMWYRFYLDVEVLTTNDRLKEVLALRVSKGDSGTN